MAGAAGRTRRRPWSPASGGPWRAAAPTRLRQGSSKPVTLTSPGARRPRAGSACKIPAASLKHQHPRGAVLRQPRREHVPRRPRPHHNKVIAASCMIHKSEILIQEARWPRIPAMMTPACPSCAFYRRNTRPRDNVMFAARGCASARVDSRDLLIDSALIVGWERDGPPGAGVAVQPGTAPWT